MLCTTPGCTAESFARGRCGKHYQYWRRRQPAGTLADGGRWTAGEDAALRRLRRNGRHTLAEIAKRLGRSAASLRHRTRLLQLPAMQRGRKRGWLGRRAPRES